MDSFHPAEVSFKSLLQTLEDSSTRASGGSWRAGAHAVYLSWLQHPVPHPYGSSSSTVNVKAIAAAPPAPVVAARTQAAAARGQQKQSGGGGFWSCFGCCGDEDDVDREREQGGGHGEGYGAGVGQAAASETAVVKVPYLDERGLRDATAGFGGFRGLPHSLENPYWQLFTPR
jgi:hypothetical protein